MADGNGKLVFPWFGTFFQYYRRKLECVADQTLVYFKGKSQLWLGVGSSHLLWNTLCEAWGQTRPAM